MTEWFKKADGNWDYDKVGWVAGGVALLFVVMVFA